MRSPLDEVGLTKDEIRELSRARRAADLGRAGVGVPVVAHSVSHRSDRREAADDRARRSACCATLGFRVCRVRHHDDDRAARARPRRDARARSSRTIADAIDRELRALGYAHVTHRPAGLPARQPERGAPAAPGLSASARAIGRRSRCALIFLAAHLALPAADARRPRLDQLRARRARTSTSRSTSRIRPAIPSSSRSAKASTAALRVAGVDAAAPRGLAIWSALGRRRGAARAVRCFFRRLEGRERRSRWWATRRRRGARRCSGSPRSGR